MDSSGHWATGRKNIGAMNFWNKNTGFVILRAYENTKPATLARDCGLCRFCGVCYAILYSKKQFFCGIPPKIFVFLSRSLV
jgi:hypothetical protein